MHDKDIRATVPEIKSVAVGFGSFVRRHKRASIAVVVAALVFGPLLPTGGGEIVVLNAVGLGFGVLLVRRFVTRRSARRPYRR